MTEAGPILLVDDDEVFRERMARALRDRGTRSSPPRMCRRRWRPPPGARRPTPWSISAWRARRASP